MPKVNTRANVYDYAEAITPSNSVNLDWPTEGIYVGGAGTVVAVQVHPTTGTPTAATYVGVAAGSILPIRAVRVNSTGTTATSLLALY